MINLRSKQRAYRTQVKLGGRDNAGFTLLELLIVIVIIAMGAAVIIPGGSMNNQAEIDVIAEKIATALRVTRSEAMRTGIAHGIIFDQDDSETTGKDIVVYQVDTSGNPFSVDHVVVQPVTKLPYDINLFSAATSPFTLLNSTPAFTFDTIGASQHLHFDPTGRPVYFQNGVAHRLLNATIQVGDNGTTRTVTLSALNGQVTVQ